MHQKVQVYQWEFILFTMNIVKLRTFVLIKYDRGDIDYFCMTMDALIHVLRAMYQSRVGIWRSSFRKTFLFLPIMVEENIWKNGSLSGSQSQWHWERASSLLSCQCTQDCKNKKNADAWRECRNVLISAPPMLGIALKKYWHVEGKPRGGRKKG